MNQFNPGIVTAAALAAAFDASRPDGDRMAAAVRGAELAAAAARLVSGRSDAVRRNVGEAVAQVLGYCNFAARLWNGVGGGAGKIAGIPLAAFGPGGRPAIFNPIYCANAGIAPGAVRDGFLTARPDINQVIFKTRAEADRATAKVARLMGRTERYSAPFGPYGDRNAPDRPGAYMVSNTVKVPMAEGIGSVRIFRDATGDLRDEYRRHARRIRPDIPDAAFRDITDSRLERIAARWKRKPSDIPDPEISPYAWDRLGFYGALENLAMAVNDAAPRMDAMADAGFAEAAFAVNAAATVAETAWEMGMHALRARFLADGPIRFNPAAARIFRSDARDLRVRERSGAYAKTHYRPEEAAEIERLSEVISREGRYSGVTLHTLPGGKADGAARRLSWIRADLRHPEVVRPGHDGDHSNGFTAPQLRRILGEFGIGHGEADRLTGGEMRVGTPRGLDPEGEIILDE